MNRRNKPPSIRRDRAPPPQVRVHAYADVVKYEWEMRAEVEARSHGDRDLPPRDRDLPPRDRDLPPRDRDLPPQVEALGLSPVHIFVDDVSSVSADVMDVLTAAARAHRGVLIFMLLSRESATYMFEANLPCELTSRTYFTNLLHELTSRTYLTHRTSGSPHPSTAPSTWHP